MAQSVDIPLNYALNSGYNFGSTIANPVLILTINIGVNGGAAQPYAFDTGSAVFLTPSGVFTGGTSSVLASGVNIDTYGSTSTFAGDVYQVTASSLKFYASPGATSGGISLGTSGNYNVASYTSLNGNVPVSQPFGTAAVGVFGADAQAFTVSGTNVGLGGVLGQTVLPNTAAGYVVSANGQSLAALNSQLGTSIAGGPVTGAQQSIRTVPQSVTSCNPCVTVGLTPALLAQFLPLNTVNAAPSGSVTPFPNSNVPGIDKFVPFTFTLSSGSRGNSEQFSRNVSLDSGWTDFKLQYSGSLANFPDPVLTISANPGGTQETFSIASSSSGVPSPYHLANASPGSNFLGIGFFEQNSVLFDLTGQQVGYSPNFVTDANISTTHALVIDSSSVPLGLAGVISGTGGISIGAGGSATLSGSNTYTGPTSISGTGAYLALVGPGTVSASSGIGVSAGGMFDISGVTSAGGATIQSLSGDSSGWVWLGANTLVLSNASGDYAGILYGNGGLTLAGGVETLSGISTYTGPTTVDGGLLVVNGILVGTSSVTVNAGGALAGSGIIDPPAVTISSGGTLAPGNPGVAGSSMTIIGDLALQRGSSYVSLVGPAGASFANVTGTASLAGTATAAFAGVPVARNFTILTSSGLNGTTFDAFNAVNLPEALVAGISYDSSNVYLNLTSRMADLPFLAGNQRAIAGILDSNFNNGSLPASFNSIYGLSGSNLANGLSSLSGEATTGAGQAAFQLMDSFLGVMLDPFVDGRAATGVDTGNSGRGGALAYASTTSGLPPKLADPDGSAVKAARLAAPAHWNVWGSAYGGSLNLNANGSPTEAHDVSAGTYGFATGADYHATPDTAFGFALAGGGSTWSLAQGPGGGNSTAAQVGVYGRTLIGPAYVAGALAFANDWVSTSRAALGSDVVNGDFVAQSVGARAEAGYRFILPTTYGPAMTLAPYAAVAPQIFHAPAFSEMDVRGGGFALNYQAADAVDTRTELGARLAASVPLLDGMTMSIWGRAAWAHDFVGNPALTASFQILPGSNFLVYGAHPADDSALLSVGSQLQITKALSLLVKFDGALARTEQVASGSATLRYSW